LASRFTTARPHRKLAKTSNFLSTVTALSLSSIAVGQASDRWEQAGGGAVAILPIPNPAAVITGGSLVCAEQRWALRLRLDRQPQVPALSDKAALSIGQADFTVEVEQDWGSATIPLTTEMLELLKSGTRLTVATEDVGDPPPSATFALRGSRAVIEAIAPLCSQVDMSAYTAVTLLETDPAVETAKPLLAAEAKLFRAATGRQPTYAATTLMLEGDKRLMFASLCGSSNYYGRSGCTLAGFAATGPTSEWRPVYNSEGVLLYTDPRASTGGWPNLVTLPVVEGAEPEHWMWNGSEYQNAATVTQVEDDVPPPR
jgi:hypothetical protein